MEQRLVVVSYPVLRSEDYARIQEIRAAHDELYFKVVEPHITFVFPTAAVGEEELVSHVQGSAGRTPRIDFVLRCAVVWGDGIEEWWHVFLVPEEGFSAIVRLHDALYRGPLAGELRLDKPFLPHMGIGTSRDPQACKVLADRINAHGVEIAGTIERLDVAVLEQNDVLTIKQVELG
jgi:2'-5' RNA ligase